MTTAPQPLVRLDTVAQAIVISDLTVHDLAVITEARRWSTGVRGDSVDLSAMAGADLSAFVSQALTVGAAAISAASSAQDTFELERLVTEVGTRAADSSAHAATQTSEAATKAAQAICEASDGARKAITEAETAARRGFTESVTAAKTDLTGEITRLFGGEQPEVLDRLRPLLDKFGAEFDAKVGRQTGELLAKAAKQFDPTDPSSPMAQHARELDKQHLALATTIEQGYQGLAGKVEALAAAIAVASAAQQASHRTSTVTPLKGHTYADSVHGVVRGIAAGLGDDYADTGTATGLVARCKKGDGVLEIAEAGARVVLEMTDSVRAGWTAYLDEAERNRGAVASLGLVREAAQNSGQSIRVIGPRRIVMAFDPACDDPELLRAVLLLLRTAAITASARHGAEEIATAEDKVTEAIGLLSRIDDIQKTAGAIRKGADKVAADSSAFATDIQRLLREALSALGGSAQKADAPAAVDGAA